MGALGPWVLGIWGHFRAYRVVLSGLGVSVLKASGFRAFWPRTLLVEGFRRDRVWGLPM